MYRFYLKLNSRYHIGTKEFKEINWLPTKGSRTTRRHKGLIYWKRTLVFFVNELFVPSRNIYKTRLHMALEIPLKKYRSKEHFIYWTIYL